MKWDQIFFTLRTCERSLFSCFPSAIPLPINCYLHESRCIIQSVALRGKVAILPRNVFPRRKYFLPFQLFHISPFSVSNTKVRSAVDFKFTGQTPHKNITLECKSKNFYNFGARKIFFNVPYERCQGGRPLARHCI